MICKQQGNLFNVSEVKQAGEHQVAEITISYSKFDKQFFLPISVWNDNINIALLLKNKNVEVEFSVEGGQWNETHQRAWPKLTLREIMEVQPQQYAAPAPTQGPPVQTYQPPVNNQVTPVNNQGPAPTPPGVPQAQPY